VISDDGSISVYLRGKGNRQKSVPHLIGYGAAMESVHGRLSLAEALQKMLDAAGCSRHFFEGSVAIDCAQQRGVVAHAER
jgi:hypothetical protein